MHDVPECAGCGCRLFKSVQAVQQAVQESAGSSPRLCPESAGRVCWQWVPAVPECAGFSRLRRPCVQAVPECTGSECRLFQSVKAVDIGSSRVSRQWVQTVPDCAGSRCRLFKKVQAVRA